MAGLHALGAALLLAASIGPATGRIRNLPTSIPAASLFHPWVDNVGSMVTRYRDPAKEPKASGSAFAAFGVSRAEDSGQGPANCDFKDSVKRITVSRAEDVSRRNLGSRKRTPHPASLRRKLHDKSPDNCPQIGWRFPTCTNCHSDGSFAITISDGSLYDGSATYWKGWGTSIAWSANYLVTLSEDLQTEILDLIYDKNKGLGLDRIRYSIPGSYEDSRQSKSVVFKQVIRQGYVPGVPKDMDDPGTWNYNWDADVEQRKVLREAMKRGVKHVDAISYSPPWWLTVSGDVTGADYAKESRECGNYIAQNIPEDNYARFAMYLAAVANHFKTKLNITFEGLSPVNEPLEGWWFKGGYHEAMSMEPQGILDLGVQMKEQLDNWWLKDTQLMLADSWGPHTADMLRLGMDMGRDKFLGGVGRIGVHGYEIPVSATQQSTHDYFRDVRNVAKELGKPIWQTEWGPMGGEKLDRKEYSSLESALWLARSVMQHVNIMEVEAWYYWLAYQQCTNECAYWGLVQRGTDPDKPRITKQYYAMSHFTKYSPKDSYMLRVDDDCEHGVMASYDPNSDRLAVHVLNQRKSKNSMELCFQGFSTPNEKDPSCSLTRTSNNENAASINCDKLGGIDRGSALPCFTFDMEPSSFSTWVFDVQHKDLNH